MCLNAVFWRRLIVVLALWLTGSAHGDNMQLDVNLLRTILDAGGNDDFKSGNGLVVNYNYDLKQWLATDIGLFLSDKTLDQSRKDVVGDYRASIQTQSLMFGVKPFRRFSAPYEIFGRLGLLLWRTELEVDEYFAPGIPGGSTSAKDNGLGYYISLGGAHYITDKILVQLEIRHMKQQDVFEGKTAFPFDLEINAFSLGVGYRF